MSTLIIPCLGRKLMNGKPQYLLRHPNGKLLIERCFEGIFPDDYQKIYIAVLQSDIRKFAADTQILNALSQKYSVDIIAFPEMTSGPAETVYEVLKQKRVTGPVVVKDSDNYLRIATQQIGNFIAGLDLNEWDRDVHNLRNKSFLILNEQKNVLDIIEKKIRSDVISLGMYGFRKAENFIRAYERLSDGSYPISKLYVSHIISYLIGYSGKVFRYIPVTEYENWGDERLWQDLQRDYTLYFVDLDHIIGESGNLMNVQREKLLALQNRGASFVGFTTQDEGYKVMAQQVLEDAGLRFLKVIYGCPYSMEKQFIHSESDLEQKVISL